MTLEDIHPCPNCGGEDYSISDEPWELTRIEKMEGHRVHLVICNSCGLVRTFSAQVLGEDLPD